MPHVVLCSWACLGHPVHAAPVLLMARLRCARRTQKLRRDIQKRETDMAVTLDELRVGAWMAGLAACTQ